MKNSNKKRYSLVAQVKKVYIVAFSIISIFYLTSVVAISYYERKTAVEYQLEDMKELVRGYYVLSNRELKSTLTTSVNSKPFQSAISNDDYPTAVEVIKKRVVGRSWDYFTFIDRQGTILGEGSRYGDEVYETINERVNVSKVLQGLKDIGRGLIIIEGRMFSFVNVQVDIWPNEQVSNLITFYEITNGDLARFSSFASHAHALYMSNVSEVRGELLILDLGEEYELKQSALEFDSGEYKAIFILSQNNVDYMEFVVREDYSIAQINSATLVAIISVPLGAGLLILIWRVFSQRNLYPIKDMVTSLKCSKYSLELDSGPEELLIFSQNYRNLAEEIKAKNQFNELLISTITDIIITVDKGNNVMFANEAALEWLGLDLQTLKGHEANLLFTNLSKDSKDVAYWLYQANKLNKSESLQGDLIQITERKWVYKCEVLCQPLEANAFGSSAMIIIKIMSKQLFEDYSLANGLQ